MTEHTTNTVRWAISASLASVLLAGSLAAGTAVSATPAPAEPATAAAPKASAPKPAAPATPAKPAAPKLPAPLASSATGGAPKAPATVDGERAVRRARTWTDAKVPYSQGGYRDGYRRDCSGFVSMAWDIPDNLITYNLPMVSKRIGKNDLRAGDILLNSRGGAGGRHAVIFEKWADAAKTKYVALEQSGGPDRAVRRVVEYPYDFDKNLYKPYRYAGMAGYERSIPKGERQLVKGWVARKTSELAKTRARSVAAANAAAAAKAETATPVAGPVVAASTDAGVLGQMLEWLGL